MFRRPMNGCLLYEAAIHDKGQMESNGGGGDGIDILINEMSLPKSSLSKDL